MLTYQPFKPRHNFHIVRDEPIFNPASLQTAILWSQVYGEDGKLIQNEGITSLMYYWSDCLKGCFSGHIEDGGYGSLNLLLFGANKYWVGVPRMELANLEKLYEGE